MSKENTHSRRRFLKNALLTSAVLCSGSRVLGANKVDLHKNAATLGPLMTVDPVGEEITQVRGGASPAAAKKLAHGTYRKPYVMPKEV